MNNKQLYAIHRWISLLALAQLAVWSITGLLFTLLSERAVMSAPAAGAHDLVLGDATAVLSLETVRARAMADHGGAAVFRIELRPVGDRPVYVVRGQDFVTRYDGETGEPLAVDRAEAEHVARRDQEGAHGTREAVLVEREAPVEFRGRPLPAWRVVLDDPEETAVWIDGRTGEVSARRTSTWRTYDFLWSLHIMDYGDRDDFRHPLIVVFAIFANLTVLSGIVLWATRVVRALRRSRPGTR